MPRKKLPAVVGRVIEPKILALVTGVLVNDFGIPKEKITPDANTRYMLGVDSLDELDLVFALDKALAVKIPLEEWQQEPFRAGEAEGGYLVVGNLCSRLQQLVAEK